jgi:hypothetical protein
VDATIVETPQMPAGDSQVKAPDFDICHLLSLDDCMTNVLLGHLGISDLSFAHTARSGLTETDNVQSTVGANLTDNSAHLGGPDFKSNDDRGLVKHVSSG